MSDLIDRQKVIDAMRKKRDAIKADLIDAVREVPTAETERDGGYWEWSDDEYETWVCSECEYDTGDYVEYNFCPNCGALMSDLIDRQAAINGADGIIQRDRSGNNDVVKAMTAWKEWVKGLPSIEPKQKTGTWVESGDSGDWHCSECKFKMPWKDQKTPYCPNCGAEMIGKCE